MAFWREPLAWWNGPVDGWSTIWGNPVIPQIRSTYATRSWPLVFRDWDGVKAFWTRLGLFAGENGAVSAQFANGTQANSIESLFEQSDRDLTTVTFTASRPVADPEALASVGAQIQHWNVSVNMSSVGSSGEFVSCHSNMPWPPEAVDLTASDLVKMLEAHTRPMTRWERLRGRPVLTKRTEAEFYADERARKVRWQSWVGGLAAGLIGALLLHWLGIK